MKRISLLVFSCLLGWGITAHAQTATGTTTVVQQPCNGNGVLAVNITGGLTLPLTYYYYDVYGNNVATHSGVASFYDTVFSVFTPIGSVYVTSASGAYYYNTSTGMVAPFTIDPPVITDAVCPSLTGTIQLTINGGTSPVSVDWYNSMMFGPDVYNSSGNPVTLPPGNYSAMVTDASGCTVFTEEDSLVWFTIHNISGINFSVATTTASCTNGTATLSGLSGGMSPYTYLWSNGASTTSISGLSQGTYSLTVTDAQGCYTTESNTVPQSITIPVNPVVTAATCVQNDGSVISFGSGGTPPYTYLYSNGFAGQTASGLSGNTSLYVTATDANGCTGQGYVYIPSSTPVVVTYSTTPSLCTAATGSATLAISGGTAPYTVSWSTSPALSGSSISGMPAGSYHFNVTDAAGCVQSGTVVIPPASTINSFINVVNPVCPATTGTVSVSVTGSSPPFTYMWNTGSTAASVTGSAGSYYCTITDNAGCSVIKYGSVFPDSPISIGLSTTPASCIYTADGSIASTVTGGTAPYVYNWSNGQTTATATGLATGYYSLSVSDANGCTQNNYFTNLGYDPAGTSCYCTISGKVYTDVNSNCIMDAGEQGIEHIMIHCSGFGYAFTDANGDYSFLVPTGSYTLSESVQYTYPLASCQSNSIPVSVTAASGCSNIVNFANNVNTIHDIHIIRTSMMNPVPGNTYTEALIVQNDGTVNESGIQLGFRHDGQLNYTSSSPLAYTQQSPVAEPNWYSVTSGFPALAPGASLAYYNSYYVPTYVPLATVVNMKDTATAAAPLSTWLTDYSPWNNIGQYQATVVGSYDPNFKEVSPKGTGPQGYIATSDSVLDYVVHFQNTGSYYAQKVVVIDTLDADLDWQSLRPGYADHSYTASLSEGGVLTLTFDNIHLDWESNNDMASRGMVTYSIMQKPNLAPGTQIKNSAAIYFDYNAPVFTNQTLNTIQLLAGIEEQSIAADLLIYPNPANDVLNVNLASVNAVSVAIYDLQGRMISRERTGNAGVQKLDISNLVKGLYFVVIENAEGQKMTKKFVKN
ncbi:MAG: hypothetical protein JWO09_1641 [Bacteroidetes bacterium]|nr:hypothetical protein [Bacteroidota bacterium]